MTSAATVLSEISRCFTKLIVISKLIFRQFFVIWILVPA